MASTDFPITEAQIITLFTDSILFGVYIVSFASLIRILVFGKARINRLLFTAAILLCIFATLGLSFLLRHVLDAFIWYRGPGGPEGEFKQISNWVNVMSPVCYGVQTWIGDLVLIYRCWVVYSKKWSVVAVPILVWSGTVVSGCGALYVTATTTSRTDINEKPLIPFITCFSVLSTFQSLLSTVLIGARIWFIDRQIAEYKPDRRLRRVFRLIVESAAIYTFSLIVFLVVFLCHNNAEYVVSVSTGRIIGIVFNMLIIRVHQGRTAETELTSMTHGTSSGRDTFLSSVQPSSLGRNEPLFHPGEAYATEPIQETVTKQVARGVDEESTFDVNTGSGKD